MEDEHVKVIHILTVQTIYVGTEKNHDDPKFFSNRQPLRF
jgi:hypothetical protein